MCIVALGWTGVLFAGILNLSFVRIVRVLKLVRSFPVLRNIHELYLLINGITSSLGAVMSGCILIFVLLGTAIMMVEWVHPTSSQTAFSDCPDCSDAFSSVGSSLLTLFNELIAGGTWILSLSLWKASPAAILMLSLTSVLVLLGLLNLTPLPGRKLGQSAGRTWASTRGGNEPDKNGADGPQALE